MTPVVAPLAAFIAHMSFADFFGLVVSVLVIVYLLYALLRGERF
jgi:K+-transporting ATPase KdpF subunit